jgi:ABC-type nitrate/sulfonate/bicarbonate transport system permease component
MPLRFVKLYARLAAVAVTVGFLEIWEHVTPTTALFVSRPSTVFRAFTNWFSNPVLRANMPITLEEAGIAFAAAMALAIALASLLAYSKILAAITAPYIAIWIAVPKIALAPVFILVFGIGVHGKVYFVALATFITPFFSLYRGLTTVDSVILDHVKVLGANRLGLIRDVYVPSVVGSTLAVLRVTTQVCMVSAVLSEIIAASKGVGYEIFTAQTNGQANFVISGVLLVALFGFLLDRIVRLLEARYLFWRETT